MERRVDVGAYADRYERVGYWKPPFPHTNDPTDGHPGAARVRRRPGTAHRLAASDGYGGVHAWLTRRPGVTAHHLGDGICGRRVAGCRPGRAAPHREIGRVPRATRIS